jgi:hypothetical protein
VVVVVVAVVAVKREVVAEVAVVAVRREVVAEVVGASAWKMEEGRSVGGQEESSTMAAR